MKFIIIGGGKPPSLSLLKKEIDKEYIIICADSGANCLYEYKIIPDYLIGDFDSIDKKVLEFFKEAPNCKIEQYPPEKDFTDTSLALSKAIDLGAEHVVFLGCTGSRLDHTCGSFGLLLKCINLNIKAFIKDDTNTIFIIDKSKAIFREDKKYLSFLAYGDNVKNLSIKKCKYELNNYNLLLGDSLTISNEFLEDEVEVSFSSGKLLVFYTSD